MSLQVEDPRSRDRGQSRSRSRHRDSDSRHDRDKGAEPIIATAEPRGSSSGLPYPMYPGGSSESSYVRPPSPPSAGHYTRPSTDRTNMPGSFTMSGGLGPEPASYSAHPTYAASPSSGGYTRASPPTSYPPFDPKASSNSITSPGGVLDNLTSFLPAKYASQIASGEEGKERKKAEKAAKKAAKADKLDEDLAYGSYVPRVQDVESAVTTVDPAAKMGPSYARSPQREYGKTHEAARYEVDDAPPLPPRYGDMLSPVDGRDENRSISRHRSNSSSSKKGYKLSYERYGEDARKSNPSVVSVEPGKSSGRDRSRSRERRRDTLTPRRDDSRERRSRLRAESSPQPPSGRLSLLTVQTPHHGASLSLASAPPSPMLEAYHGTYQAMSPMPSPILGPSMGADGFYPASPRSRSSSSSDDDFRSPSSPRFERRARFHDAADDARTIAEALRGKTPDIRPLIEILPGMSHDQIMELRLEYKRIVTTGPQKLGVNIAKHIRSKLKDEDSNLMKACYATALGRWESEAYWANFWYQGDKTRRELLIEALMGRTNAEIREIRHGFNDKKYDNSLSKCMRTELKEDKFKKAVMMVLEEKRMEDWDVRHERPMKIDRELVEEDVKELHKAVKSTRGGETAMLSIVVMRSDGHLKEVLRQYEKTYRSNFAKEALKKSGNLVGEVLAHILNGVINKPLRDAMLVHHALSLSRKDSLKRELLISRLVRYHWDREHMRAVKRCYRERYGKDMQDAVAKEVGDKEWGHFCEQLCINRMPGSVRQLEKVEIIPDRRRD